VADLPSDFPALLVYAQDRAPGTSTAAADLLRRGTHLEVRRGDDGTEVERGTLTVPRADMHVRLTPERRLKLTPGHPGTELADELFSSAAQAFGPRVLAIVLRDGTAGVQAVKARGGRVIAQDPATRRAGGSRRGSSPAGIACATLSTSRASGFARSCSRSRGVFSLVVVSADGGAPVEIATVGHEGFVGLPVFLQATLTGAHMAFSQVEGEALRMDAADFLDAVNEAPRCERPCSATRWRC
jgi:two-component system chemotaxis response regulator CheB